MPCGKCTNIHTVFVSLARAAGVPAREVLGIRQGTTNNLFEKIGVVLLDLGVGTAAPLLNSLMNCSG